MILYLSFTSMANNGGQNVVEVVLINNLGFKVMVNSGTKHAFKNEKRH